MHDAIFFYSKFIASSVAWIYLRLAAGLLLQLQASKPALSGPVDNICPGTLLDISK
jgi:hypothetical protein